MPQRSEGPIVSPNVFELFRHPNIAFLTAARKQPALPSYFFCIREDIVTFCHLGRKGLTYESIVRALESQHLLKNQCRYICAMSDFYYGSYLRFRHKCLTGSSSPTGSIGR